MALSARPTVWKDAPKRLRGYTLTPDDVVELQKVVKQLHDVEILIALCTAEQIPPVAIQGLIHYRDELRLYHHEITHFIPPVHLPQYTRKAIISDVASALKHPAIRGNETYFQNYFVYTPALVRLVAPLLFPEGLQVPRRRPMGGEECLLLLLAMGRAKDGLKQVCAMWDVDFSHTSSYYALAMDTLTPRAVHLTKISHLYRFHGYGPRWRIAMQDKFVETARRRGLNDLAEYWTRDDGPAVLFDGLRQPIARPSDATLQFTTWSGYMKENDMLTGVVVSPDGLYLAFTQFYGGHANDTYTVNQETIIALEVSELPALCDGAFQPRPNVLIPIPTVARRAALGISDAECAVASSVRIPVEWSFGKLETQFNRAFNEITIKLLGNSSQPEALMRVYGVLSNIMSLYRGNEGSEYFGLQNDIDLLSYLNWNWP